MSQMVHIVCRGVDKRKIFLDGRDYARFVHDLWEFNDTSTVTNSLFHFNKNMGVGHPYSGAKECKQTLVDLHAFCLMPNHYHLLVTPKEESGTSRFMKKINGGYALYFNKKRNRKGTLFESRYKAIPIEHHSHFVHILYYIHLNPLDLKFPEWRTRELKDYKGALALLDSYKWSSHQDYIGKKNFPSVTSRKLMLDFFEGEKGYSRAMANWLREMDTKSVEYLIRDTE